MPRNHGRTAISANCTVHSKIRTILRVLTILTIVRSVLAQERPSSAKDDDKDYLVKWKKAYGPPTSLSIFMKGDDNETSGRESELSKETFEGSKERRYSRWWKEKEEEKEEEEEEEEERRRDVNRWKRNVNKAGLTVLGVNTVKRTIGKEYVESRSFNYGRRGGMEEVKENEENERGERGGGDNEESSRSKEDRNSNNFMTEPGTPRNRRSETEEEEKWEESEERSKGVRGRRSSWILDGASIKRSNHEDAARGDLSRKGEMSFSTRRELDDDLRRDEEEEEEEEEKRRRRGNRKERKRRRRGANSSFGSDEWNASNRSVLEKRKVRIEGVKVGKEIKSGRGTTKEREEKKVKKWKEENRKFVTTISSRNEWREQEEKKRKGWTGKEKRTDESVGESFGEIFRKREEEGNVSRRGVVDNFSGNTTLSYLSPKVRKSTRRDPDAPNRRRSTEDSGIPPRYRDNTPLGRKAIGFRSRKETEDKDGMTTRGGNRLRDKAEKEEEEEEEEEEEGEEKRKKGEANADLKSRKKNVPVTKQRSRWDTEKILKKFTNSQELATTIPPGSTKYTKEERKMEKNRIDRVESSNENKSLSEATSTTLLKSVSPEKENEKDLADRGRVIRSTTPKYFSGEARNKKEERESPGKNRGRDLVGGKEAVSRSVGNISENTVVSWNSTYPNHDTFDSSWVYSTGWPIVESNGRGGAVESSKDSERNVGDPVENSESPKLLETLLPYFPIAKASIVRDEESGTAKSTKRFGDVEKREKVQRYEVDEMLLESGRKKSEGVTSDTRDSEIDEKQKQEVKTDKKKTHETISLEYFPRSTSLASWEITTSWVAGEEEEEEEEEEITRKVEDREVSDYEKGMNGTRSDPMSAYKFELLQSVVESDATTSSVSTTLSDDIREKMERNDVRRKKDRKVKRLKEEDPKFSNSNRTALPKSKRSKSIGLTGIGGKNSSSSGNAIVAEKSGENQETKMEENVDPISRSSGNIRTSGLRRDTTETTVESSVEGTTSIVSNGPIDRSISITDVEIEGITSPLPFDVSPPPPPPPGFPSDRFDTIVATSIGENVNPSVDVTERNTISWEETTIYNSSYKQSISSTHNITDQWPVKHSAVVEGDLVLGGLMMVHEREDTITCGPVMPQGGVQALEAMLYTLDRLNQREIVPGVKIGAHILDDCDKDTYGLEMAVDFIKGSISNIDGAEYHCNKTTVRKVISGVVGAASSVTSIQVANLLRLFRIPQVSFFSTSPELSNKQRFEYFTRTIPSDHYQVKAMVDIVLKMGWSYVSIIYEESNYGIKAFEELEELLTKNDICIAIKEKLVKDSGVAEETAYDNIVLKLLTKPRSKGCIIFGSDQEVAGVMRAVRRCNATGAFSWIGSDGWSARGLVSNGNEAEVEGTLSVQPQANPVRGFEEYFLNLTVENNRRNPWFVEFWEDHFQCRYPNSSQTPYNKKYTKICSTKERLTKENTVFEDQLQFVSDAVMAFAYAFRDMHRDLCGSKAGLCDTMKPTKGTELLRYLRKVNFEGLSGDKFRFDKNGDGPARYNIIHFKQTEPGVYKWIRVGKYLEGVLHLNMSMVQFKLGHNQTPESVCSLPCEVGQAKKYVEGESCCWHCFNCSQYQIRHPDDETQCKNCRQGTVPDETHSTCRDIPEEFLRLESGWAIGAMSFSAIGILVTLFVCGVFLKHNDTPVVRASGRELSYVLLTGILLCYLVTFALVLRPTDLVCSIQRFGAGFCFTVVYAALLTKTNRISRIFNAGKHSAKRPSFISPRSQLIICSGLVGVQILINGVWIVIDPAKAMHHYPTKEDNLLVCNSYIDASYMIAFAYPIMLIVVCTIYAILTRKIPEAFNESKYIGFTMYTTCVIWLAFVPLYFGTGNHVALRITSMSVTISLSASVTIACLFTPKLYIILIRPERNVRQNIMPARPYNTTKSSAVTGTNASSMMAPVTLTAVTCDQNKAVKKHIITTMDCSTQSEYYELEVKELKNGRPSPSFVSRATQTQSNNNEKEPNDSVHHVDKESKDNARQTNNTKIGNGPVNQNDVAL